LSSLLDIFEPFPAHPHETNEEVIC